MRRNNSRYIFFSLIVFLGFMFFALPQTHPLKLLTKNDESRSFEVLYSTYVDLEAQRKCEGKPLTCKEFYLAQNIAIKEPSVAILYYHLAYENNISSIIDDPTAKDAYLFINLANAYTLVGDLEKARLWFERSLEAEQKHKQLK